MSEAAKDPRTPHDPRVPHQTPEDARPVSPPVGQQSEPQLHQPVWKGYGVPPQDDTDHPTTLLLPAKAQRAPQPQPPAPAPGPGRDSGGYGYPGPGSATNGPNQYQPQPQPPYGQGGNQYQQTAAGLPAAFSQPPYGPPSRNPNEPDWSALADRQASRSKRKRLLLIVAGVVAVALVGGGTAFGMGAFGSSSAKNGKHTQGGGSPSPTASQSAAPGPTQPTAVDPADLLSAGSLKVGGKTYTWMIGNTSSPCWKVTANGLGSDLTAHSCTQVQRATYLSGTSAITVGIAVFPTAADAAAATAQYAGTLVPLNATGDGVSPFCVHSACAVTHAAHGRYAYFTIAGPTSGAAGTQDSDALAAGPGFDAYALSQIMRVKS